MRPLTLLALTLALPFFAAEPKATEPKERFNCNLALMNGPVRVGTTFFTVLIDDYTSDAEAQELRDLLKAKGAAAVQALIRDKELGAMFTTGSLATPLCFIRQFPLENGKGRRIVGIASRRTRFGEHWYDTRSLDYPWSMVDFTIDENGKGKGVLYETARFEYDEKGKLLISSQGTQPTRLLNVKLSKKK